MKYLLLAAIFLLSIFRQSIASPLDPATNKYIRSLTASNMAALVSAEQDISKLSTDDKEFVLFTTSTYLNQKFSNLKNVPTARDLNYQQRAYVMAVAIGRLQLLAHMSGFHAPAECYSVEATGLLAISRGENVAPSNCRLNLYDPKVQGRYASESRSPQDSPLAALSNRWATAAILNGMYSGALENYGASTPEYSALQNQAGQCENEFRSISSLPISQYEAVYIETSNQLLSWFVSFTERKGASPWEQKWAYLTWSKGTILLGNNATRSARLELVLNEFGENASAFVRNEKSFEQYMVSNSSLADTLDKIGKSLLHVNPNLPSQFRVEGETLSNCVIESAGASARRELLRK